MADEAFIHTGLRRTILWYHSISFSIITLSVEKYRRFSKGGLRTKRRPGTCQAARPSTLLPGAGAARRARSESVCPADGRSESPATSAVSQAPTYARCPRRTVWPSCHALYFQAGPDAARAPVLPSDCMLLFNGLEAWG
jgi:hypothetical protein